MLELLVHFLGALRALPSGRAHPVWENLLLRHQLAALTRPGRKRPRLRARDELPWILARRLCPGWHRHPILVWPEIVTLRHREAWKLPRGWRPVPGSAGHASILRRASYSAL